jgi:CRP/FNR family transcriptional regulator, cyclic AMP receptor protein
MSDFEQTTPNHFGKFPYANKNQGRTRWLAPRMESKAAMIRTKRRVPDWGNLISGISGGNTPTECGKNQEIFRQGDRADSLFYLRRGEVRLGVRSGRGEKAILAVLGAGQFFGEGCLAGQTRRMTTATATTICTLVRIEKPLMLRMLHEQHEISEMFATLLLTRNMRYEEDLLDQIFNSCEKRLARVLLLLARYGGEPSSQPVLPGVSQEALAQMLGISSTQVCRLMSKFKKLGFIDDEKAGLKINNGLLRVVLNN